jgi:prepilin-type N-terminal cleavage/methylation domain-containing protein
LKQNERGLTLIEVLASLTILSIIGVTIWSVFFQGYNFSQKSISKNFIIQETNIVISNLTRIHQKTNEYEFIIPSSKCEFTVNSKIASVTNPTVLVSQPAQTFQNSRICLSIQYVIEDLAPSADPNKIIPNKNDVSITITASDINDPQNKVETKSYLYRVKGAGY